MPSNNSGIRVGYLCHQFPGRLGWLISPGGWRRPPEWHPVALDNGAFPAFTKKQTWDELAWMAHMAKAHSQCQPIWAVVPDVVTERQATIDRWHEFAPWIRKHYPKTPLAFAVQDGMDQEDVPEDADVVFVGGSYEWKWETASAWAELFPHVHVARVNSPKRLYELYEMGVTSCDGTGWFRGDPNQTLGLIEFLEYQECI